MGTVNLDLAAVNSLINGTTSIKVGIDTIDLLYIFLAIVGSIVIGGLLLKMVTKNIK